MEVKTNITEQTVTYIFTHIQDGSWPVGMKIPSENQLTMKLGISRSSVRAAIHQLIGVGILQSIHGKGTFVLRDRGFFSPLLHESADLKKEFRSIKEILEFRYVFEPECCFLAAKRKSETHLEQLDDHLKKMKESIDNQNAFVYHDMAFHLEICRAVGNNLLELCMKDTFEQTVTNHRQVNDLYGYSGGIYFHEKILAAIRAGSASTARKLMQDHLGYAYENL